MSGRSIEPFREIARRLAEVRHSKGLTQRELAALLNKPRSYISKLEMAERRLDIVDLESMATVLEVPPEVLLLKLLGR